MHAWLLLPFFFLVVYAIIAYSSIAGIASAVTLLAPQPKEWLFSYSDKVAIITTIWVIHATIAGIVIPLALTYLSAAVGTSSRNDVKLVILSAKSLLYPIWLLCATALVIIGFALMYALFSTRPGIRTIALFAQFSLVLNIIALAYFMVNVMKTLRAAHIGEVVQWYCHDIGFSSESSFDFTELDLLSLLSSECREALNKEDTKTFDELLEIWQQVSIDYYVRAIRSRKLTPFEKIEATDEFQTWKNDSDFAALSRACIDKLKKGNPVPCRNFSKSIIRQITLVTGSNTLQMSSGLLIPHLFYLETEHIRLMFKELSDGTSVEARWVVDACRANLLLLLKALNNVYDTTKKTNLESLFAKILLPVLALNREILSAQKSSGVDLLKRFMLSAGNSFDIATWKTSHPNKAILDFFFGTSRLFYSVEDGAVNGQAFEIFSQFDKPVQLGEVLDSYSRCAAFEGIWAFSEANFVAYDYEFLEASSIHINKTSQNDFFCLLIAALSRADKICFDQELSSENIEVLEILIAVYKKNQIDLKNILIYQKTGVSTPISALVEELSKLTSSP